MIRKGGTNTYARAKKKRFTSGLFDVMKIVQSIIKELLSISN